MPYHRSTGMSKFIFTWSLIIMSQQKVVLKCKIRTKLLLFKEHKYFSLCVHQIMETKRTSDFYMYLHPSWPSNTNRRHVCNVCTSFVHSPHPFQSVQHTWDSIWWGRYRTVYQYRLGHLLPNDDYALHMWYLDATRIKNIFLFFISIYLSFEK